ncbi:flippase-like domain-containing protein [Capillimicrobium parvum]|uniref:D-inositol-3-phosphate glycosyltransferase n=1 Tax=Capillimicrobium parvum TaxID=2884022 RepID=A0A9E6Y0T1_9ACTN|nr:flippase-like domain-containing protein [Capillimicrobium parvum]UGS38087.1 D-inositol-3-phosphate glycosyltransferase [Capillimicrobium parvum]
MRIALVSPYSWTYPGGVTRHIEALSDQFIARGHDVTVLAPYDPDDALSPRLHRGARPQARPLPAHLVSLGRSAGFSANGAQSNVALTPYAAATARRELTLGGYDVVHLHEPVVPMACWDTLGGACGVPLVGTFHTYSENSVTHGAAALVGARRRMNRLAVRIAVSEAAAWTGRRFYGGRYRVIPNGVEVGETPTRAPRAPGEPLRIAFVGQAVERKGLPVLLRAFEALRDHVPAELVIVGAGPEDVTAMLEEPAGITALGKVDDERKLAVLRDADVLCAPSLGGESFGMVLTEAFAAGTPVIASDIAGYRDVVRDGADGLLVPRGDATALAEQLRDLALDPAHESRLGAEAARSAERFAWPHVADEVFGAYEDAIAAPRPETASERLAMRFGRRSGDGLPVERARRLPSLEPPIAGRPRPAVAFARRAAIGLAAVAGVGLSWLALQRIGIDRIVEALWRSSPAWVLSGLALMCLSMVFRAVAWRAILRAALPGTRVRLRDSLRGTAIGVLMSATLPARLGEPSRALVVARRIGRPRQVLPTVVGTIVSQTLLNVLALIVLGFVMFSTVGLFAGHQGALIAFASLPVVILLAVIAAPALLRKGAPSRSRRVAQAAAQARRALTRVRAGLLVFRDPRLGSEATVMQLGAWALQWLSCYLLLVALGLDMRAGLGAAAAVLFAVNVTAAVPLTPSNLGVFQAACVAVLTAGYGVGSADALAFGIILQAVEIATAFIMGAPALVGEGLSWKDVRVRALHTAPVELRPMRGDSRAKLKA